VSYKFTLQKYCGPSSKYLCPSCNQQKRFTRYIDNETGELLPDHVGRCDREDKCGYNYTPKQYFEETKHERQHTYQYKRPYNPIKKIEPKKPIDYLPEEVLNRSTENWEQNNFAFFLIQIFGFDRAKDLCELYLIGNSKHWQGATAFWFVDIDLKVRQVKVMHYTIGTGTISRTKSHQPAYKWSDKTKEYFEDINYSDKIFKAGKKILNNQEANLLDCFFGEHLLKLYPQKKVAIVESEKTAIICSVYYPKYVWIATGGINGCKWTEREVCKVLQGREIVLFPDLNCFDKWSEKAKEIKSIISCKIRVSSILEKKPTEEQRSKGCDLADFVLVTDKKSGLALTDDEGYPIIWDLNKECKQQ
jgi:hypothetical protein